MYMKNFCTSLIMLMLVTTGTSQFLEKKKDLKKFEGFFNFHYSERDGEIYLEVDKLDTDFLYVHALRSGLGSNDIGLDRGQLGGGELVKFVKAGNKILLLQPNVQYRASSENEMERKSISEAFAKSVLFGFEIKDTINNNYVIDLTPFLMEDAHGIANRLKTRKEGTYKPDKTRSAIWMERTKAFPRNVEFDALLTFVGTPEGSKLRTVAPNAESVSVIQHHSFVELPGPGYTPRVFDPRSGSYPTAHFDYSSPISDPIKKMFITRHRLEKINPAQAKSEAAEPIIYYLDPGTPEPVRTALLEGARWWNEAFEAIGYTDAFQVKMLPEEADPLDVRYNVIQWVHRSTRGWSYGSTITDPRTGEIIKGHVSLGSLRIRQDFMIAQALMNKPFANSDDFTKPMLDMALARIRQLSAHEVGHTLGFAHNFAASTNNRASVMDYPHPYLSLLGSNIDLSNAYDSGIGEWDKVTVAYSYSDIPKTANEKTYLNAILEGAFANGLRYITDSDARAQGGAHPGAHLWDNGPDAVVEMHNILSIRKQGMSNFSIDNIRTGEPLSVLEDVFVPLYFLHRYQTEATVKLVGGMDYDYSVKGYNSEDLKVLTPRAQQQALESVLNTLDPTVLRIPEELLDLFPPRAFGYDRSRESFKSDMGVSFDALGAAATSAEHTLKLLLNPARMNRLVQQKALHPSNLGAQDVLDALFDKVYMQKVSGNYLSEINKTVQYVTLQRLIALEKNPKSMAQVKAQVNEKLDNFHAYISDKEPFGKQLLREITAYRMNPEKYKITDTPDIPDGSPIGTDCMSYFN